MTEEGKRKIIEHIEKAFSPFRCVVQTKIFRTDLELIDGFSFVLFDHYGNCVMKKEAITFNHIRHVPYLETNIRNWRYEIRRKGRVLDKHPLDDE